jgi:predicted permease
VLLPIIVFKSLLDEIFVFRETFATYAFFYFAGAGLSFAVSLVLFKNVERKKRCTSVLASTLRNPFFIPIALVIAFDLPESAIIGVISFTICYHLFQPFLTMALAMRMHGTYAKDVLIKGLTFPPLRAAIFGISLGLQGFNFHLPAFHELKLGTSYLSLVYVGLVLSKAPIPTRADVSIITRVGFIRLLLAPLVFLPLFYNKEYPMNVVIAREVGSPTSVSAVLYAALFGFDDELMAKIVVYVTFVGILVLPLWLLFLS